jgi:hypothetical protein
MIKFTTHLFITIVLSIFIWFLIFSFFSVQLFQGSSLVADYKFKEMPNKLEANSILFMGDSTIMNGILPTHLKQKAFNASTHCAGPFDFYNLIKRIDLDKAKPRFIILSQHAHRLTHQEGCIENDILAFNEYSSIELYSIIKEESSTNYFKKSSTLELFLNLVLFKLYLHPSQLSYLSNIDFLDSEKNNSKQYIFNLLTKQQGYLKCASPEEFKFDSSKDSYSDGFKIHPFDAKFMKKFLETLESKNIKVIFLNPIYSKSYEKILTASYFSGQELFFKNLMNEHKNLYYDNEITFLDNSFFQDSIHLNEKGAIIYTKWTQDKINNLILKKIVY